MTEDTIEIFVIFDFIQIFFILNAERGSKLTFYSRVKNTVAATPMEYRKSNTVANLQYLTIN